MSFLPRKDLHREAYSGFYEVINTNLRSLWASPSYLRGSNSNLVKGHLQPCVYKQVPSHGIFSSEECRRSRLQTT